MFCILVSVLTLFDIQEEYCSWSVPFPQFSIVCTCLHFPGFIKPGASLPSRLQGSSTRNWTRNRWGEKKAVSSFDNDLTGEKLVRHFDSPYLRLQLDIFHLQYLKGDLTNNIQRLLPIVGKYRKIHQRCASDSLSICWYLEDMKYYWQILCWWVLLKKPKVARYWD